MLLQSGAGGPEAIHPAWHAGIDRHLEENLLDLLPCATIAQRRQDMEP
jgi:hypothetical protein